ncbi:hypothetical protein ABVT39_007043 [Epinephelus coioides]
MGDVEPSSPPAPAGAQSGSAAVPDRQLSFRTTTSASCCKFLKEAILRRSGGLLHPTPSADSPPPGAEAADPPQHLSGHARSPIPWPAHSPDADSPPSNLAKTLTRPLFPPTTLIIGDSITRNIRFFNATTCCFPGATVPGILGKLPSSITHIVVHVGTDDLARGASELTKSAFTSLLDLLHTCGKSVFISGHIPTLGRLDVCFSRLLLLNTWLMPACYARGFKYMDNFNLFWNRPSFFKYSGILLTTLGSRMLAVNIQHAVHHVPHA